MLCWVDGSGFDLLSLEADTVWLVDHNDPAYHRLGFHRPLGVVLDSEVANNLCWEDGSVFDLLSLEADSLL